MAGLRADPAVLMMLRVLFALIGAHPAGGAAGLNHLGKDLLIRAGAARTDRARGKADVRAVKSQPDALFETLDILLGQAGVGARCAGLGARITFLDTAQQRIRVFTANVGMGKDHLLYVHIVSPSLEISAVNG
jgi:hypothetical protein